MPGKWLKLGLNLSELYIYLKKIETRLRYRVNQVIRKPFVR